ncbi:MAG: alanine racemase, partial [Deltaproteobacteria bacterium]|nr:alanine racemase [Deltaproteobacteria bacterium]
DSAYTSYQLGLFRECVVNIEKAFGPIPIWHIANRAAVIKGTFLIEAKASEHWVRPGLMLY